MRDSLTGQLIYKFNQYQLQKYTDDYYKFIFFKKPLRIKGYEIKTIKSPKGSVNNDKLDNNIARTKNKIFEYAMCNQWDMFCTFTVDGSKFLRSDLKGFYRLFSKWLNNLNYRHNLSIKYLFIPELHSDKENWHFHGLMNGLPHEMLSDFVEGVHPQKLIDKGYKNWADYEKRFGFCSFDFIRDKNRISSYITKYITKDLSRCVNEVNSCMFYSSKGLKCKQVVSQGEICIDGIDFDYDNEYVSVKIIRENMGVLK